MKLTVVTYGTEGDVRPLAALCRALMDAGHDAQLLADGSTLDSAEALEVPAVPLSSDIKGELRPNGGIAGVVSGGPGLVTVPVVVADSADTEPVEPPIRQRDAVAILSARNQPCAPARLRIAGSRARLDGSSDALRRFGGAPAAPT